MVFFGKNTWKAVIDALSRSQAMIEFTPDGNILSANRNFLDAMGYKLEEIQGKHHRMFVDPDYAAGDDYRTFWRELSDGEFKAAEFLRYGKDGKEVWIQATYNPVLNAAGKVIKVVKFASDITAQKLKAADSEGQIDAINQSQAVIHFELDGTIIGANENFLNAVGYRLDEIQGRHHSMFVAPEERESAEYRRFWQELADGAFKSDQFRRLGKGGKEI